MKDYTLAVIDVQPGLFPAASNTLLLEQIEYEIKAAKRDKAGIVLVEYANSPKVRSYAKFYDLLKNYKFFTKTIKHNDDGSKEIIKAITNNRFPDNAIYVAGVNTDYCVKDTAVNLAKQLPNSQIVVLRNAVNSHIRPVIDWDQFLQDWPRNLSITGAPLFK